MRRVNELTTDELVAIVESIQLFLYVDSDAEGNRYWEPDKVWSGADVCDHLASLLNDHDLIPESREFVPDLDASN